MKILRAQQRGETVHGRVRLLRDGFLDLDLQDEVRASLEVKAKLDLIGEVVLHLGERGGEHRVADQKIDTENDDGKDEQAFPLQIRFNGKRVKRVFGRRAASFASFDS